jgi:hypothetical protein
MRELTRPLTGPFTVSEFELQRFHCRRTQGNLDKPFEYSDWWSTETKEELGKEMLESRGSTSLRVWNISDSKLDDDINCPGFLIMTSAVQAA